MTNRASHIQIEHLAPPDYPTLRDIIWRTWLATYASFVPETDLKLYFDEYYSIAELAGFFSAPGASGRLALLDERPVGITRTRWSFEEQRFYLTSIYVLAEAQGKGVGSALFAEAEEQARVYGVDRIWLGVMRDNAATLRWYEKIGFEFGPDEPFTMGKTSVPHRIGSKLLSPTSTGERSKS